MTAHLLQLSGWQFSPLCFVGYIFPLFKMCHIFLLIAFNLGFMTKQNKPLQMFRPDDPRPCQSIFLLEPFLPSFVALGITAYHQVISSEVYYNQSSFFVWVRDNELHQVWFSFQPSCMSESHCCGHTSWQAARERMPVKAALKCYGDIAASLSLLAAD